jgi:haloalkane dehalogenase
MKLRNYDSQLYPFESKWITVNGNRIHYIDEGKGQIILFCHPPVTSSFMYRNMIKELRSNFRCIALDFPGFGLSEAAGNYSQSIRSQTEIVQGFIDQLKLNDLTLLMQEIGGHAAFSVFMKQPERLKAIIITDTILFPVSQYPKILKMLNFVNGGLFNFLNSNFNFLIRAMTKFGIRKRKLTKDERNIYKAMFNTKEIRRSSTALLHQLTEEEGLLSQIQKAFETTFNGIAALIIYGEKDPLTGLGIPQRINKLLPNSELHWIKSEMHFPHEGSPVEMSNIISEWMNRNN